MFQSFQPPQRTLMGPGPSIVHPRVLEASARHTIGHLDPAFGDMMDQVKIMLRHVFQTENAMTMPVSAPGSAGMESCFANLIEPGDKVLVCINGVFGGRMKENVERCGGIAVVIEDEWGQTVDPEKVEQAFAEHDDIRILAFVHAETSTGVESDARALAEIARKNNALVIVDAVTSLAGIPLLTDEWQLDAVYSGSQKCMSCLPGISPVTFSERAMQKIGSRNSKVQSWFLDLNLVMGYWQSGSGGGRSYHHTAPVNALYALHESLVMVCEEGLENSWDRHSDSHQTLVAGLKDIGLEMLVDESVRLPQLNAVKVPDGVDEAEVRRYILREHNLEIGAGLGALAGKIWRIGLMGESARKENVDFCLSALKEAIDQQHALSYVA